MKTFWSWAPGPIGLSVMQFALAAKSRVIAMDVSAKRLQFCRETLGVANHNRRQIGRPSTPNCARFATVICRLVFWTRPVFAGSMEASFERIAPGGRIVFVGLFQGEVTFDDPNFHRREITLMSSRNATSADFERTLALIENGKIDTAPWITHRLKLENVVSDFRINNSVSRFDQRR